MGENTGKSPNTMNDKVFIGTFQKLSRDRWYE